MKLVQCLVAVSCVAATSAFASIDPGITPIPLLNGNAAQNQSFTYSALPAFTRGGTVSSGKTVAWTEATVWQPPGNIPFVLGNRNAPNAQTTEVVPAGTAVVGNGTYWIQYRLVDNLTNYNDAWISFNVTGTPPPPPPLH